MAMDPERWRLVTRLFDELVELNPGPRVRRLAAIGNDDPALRRQVEALLDADTDADSQIARAVPLTAASDPLALSGRRLSHFAVLDPLGSGGMGVVYRATDTLLGRTVAIKLPHAEPGLDHSWKERFLREARAAAALDHPNLCQIYEVGETTDGRPFLAMPLYQGETLRTRLGRSGPLPVVTAVDIARQIAAGLGAMHAVGIVHRDLKPGNVMLLPDRSVKILDFGLAKPRDAELTDERLRPGTVAYMAPEQVRGHAVDGRTDLWALGVVLYEILTGRRPFEADDPIALAHAIVHETPAGPATIRPELPGQVSAVVMALLSAEPDDRDAAARALVEGRVPVRPARRGRVALAAAAVAGLAALGWTLARGWHPGPRPALDANLLAVAPFDALDPTLQLWREGLVDILSRDLDRAGPIRTVSQSVALQRWTGRADPASADALGRRTRAGLVVFGSIVRRTSDSVSLRAAILDRSRNVVGPDLEVAGVESHLGEMADSLGLRILRTLGGGRPIASVRNVSIGSRSLPALKAFLRGEQFYRRGQWDSALASYDRAVTEDSTYGLALRRMWYVLGWGAATSDAYGRRRGYLERAVISNHGVSRRDSLLFAAESLTVASIQATEPGAYLASLSRSVDLLEEAARRYPDDPEVWYHLGEGRMHLQPRFVQQPPLATLQAFDRAIALDSGFTPAYEHTVELAMQLGAVDRARRYARAYTARHPADADAPSLALVALILDSGVTAPAVAAVLRGASANTLVRLGNDHLRWWTDSAETTVAIVRELGTGQHDVTGAPDFVTDTLLWRQYLAGALAFRGHLHEAARVYAPLLDTLPRARYGMDDPFRSLTLLGAVPESIGRRAYAEAFRPEATWDGSSPPRYLRGLSWWMARGDTNAIFRFARRAQAVAAGPGPPRARVRGRYLAAAAEAYVALARRDTTEAMRRFRGIPDSLCLAANCFMEKLTLARLLAARGQQREAAAMLDRWMSAEGATPLFVLARLERGRLAERLGDSDEARRAYRFVADVWRRADPELRPYVTEAAAGLRRVDATP